MTFDDYPALDNCKNIESSFGELCVHCNKCGRFDEKPIIIKIPKVGEWTITDLRYTCRKNKVKGYTKMDRQQLIIAVNDIIRNKYSKYGSVEDKKL